MNPTILDAPFFRQQDLRKLIDEGKSPTEQRKALIENLVVGQPYYEINGRTLKVEENTYLGYFGGAFFSVSGKKKVTEHLPVNAAVISYFVRDLGWGTSPNFDYPTKSYYLCEKQAYKALAFYLEKKAKKANDRVSVMEQSTPLTLLTDLARKNYVKLDVIKQEEVTAKVLKVTDNKDVTESMLIDVDNESDFPYKIFSIKLVDGEIDNSVDKKFIIETNSADQAFVILFQ